jgi:hypothetical protein
VAESESICGSNMRFEEAAARVRVAPGESGDGFVTALTYLPTLLFQPSSDGHFSYEGYVDGWGSRYLRRRKKTHLLAAQGSLWRPTVSRFIALTVDETRR